MRISDASIAARLALIEGCDVSAWLTASCNESRVWAALIKQNSATAHTNVRENNGILKSPRFNLAAEVTRTVTFSNRLHRSRQSTCVTY
jgi:hypothetical protein